MGQTQLKSSQVDMSGLAGVVPVGGIIIWSGSIASIPATWALCDGTANSPGPDLRDKFVVGAKQDEGGIAKTNIEGTLTQSGGTTAHSHPFTISDHTGLTHGLTIANHPDITHAALASHPTNTTSIASHPTTTTSIASHPTTSMAGLTHSAHATINSSVNAAGGGLATIDTGSAAHPSHPTQQVPGATHANISLAGISHANISLPGLTHADLGTHAGTDYGVHSITAPPSHGTAGTLVHSFNENSVSQVPTFYALAFIQRMS